MQVTYTELRGKPRTFCSLTGLRVSEFEALLPSFSDAWDNFVQKTFEHEGRKRAMGAGRKAHLKTLEDKLLFILMYFRLYPTQEVQGFLFGMSQGQANQWIHRLTGVLNQALGYEQQLPKKKPRQRSLSTIEKRDNQNISSVRVEVEHHIGGIKRCQILVQPFRNWVDHYIDDVMETAWGLHNFRLTHRRKQGNALGQAA